MTTTFGDMTDEVIAYLHGFTSDQEQHTTLTAGIDSDDLVFQVKNARSLSRGVAQLGDELIWVESVDVSTNLVVVPDWGRGYQGSTAAAHLAGSQVTAQPTFPRHRVKRVLNDVIRSLYPALFAVSTDTSNTVSSVKTTYPLPAGARSIISVSYDATGPSEAWVPVKTYRMDKSADTTDFPSGVSLDILSWMSPGRRIKVVYRKEPSVLDAEADLFTETGLPTSASDVVVWGALSRLLPAIEMSRLQSDAVEQSDRQRLVQPGSANAASRQALQMFTIRLEQEREKLMLHYPLTAHLTR